MSEAFGRQLADHALIVLAVVFVAILTARTSQAPETPRAGLLDVRQIELAGKLLDAQAGWTDSLREQIGIKSDGDEKDALVRHLHDTIVGGFGWSARMRLIGAAMCVSFDRGADALDLLAKLDPAQTKVPILAAFTTIQSMAHAQVQAAQTTVGKTPKSTLRRGPNAPRKLEKGAFERGLDNLSQLGASQWLRDRLRANWLTTIGDKKGAAATQAKVEAASTDLVMRLGLLLLASLGLGILGFLLLLPPHNPFAIRRLKRSGICGLEDTVTPFRYDTTPRVIATWFVGFTLTSVVVGGAFAQLASGTSMIVLGVLAGVICQGAIAIALLQVFARREGDPQPLSTCLKLRITDLRGGYRGLALWTFGGVAITVCLTFGAMIVNHELVGDRAGGQGAVELLANARGLGDRVILLASVLVFAPLFEEIFFRGYVFRNLRDKWGPGAAYWASAFLFGMAHMDLHNLLPLTMIGFCLAYLYEHSGSLLVPIVVHGVWNSLTVMRVLTVMGD